jgi:hypothetical protein
MYVNSRFKKILSRHETVTYKNKEYPLYYYCKKCKHLHRFKENGYNYWKHYNYRMRLYKL